MAVMDALEERLHRLTVRLARVTGTAQALLEHKEAIYEHLQDLRVRVAQLEGAMTAVLEQLARLRAQQDRNPARRRSRPKF
jgi:chromosome segregation ATPase